MVIFSTKKGIFFAHCRSACGASSYYCCRAGVYTDRDIHKKGDSLCFEKSTCFCVYLLGHTVVVKSKSITSVIRMGDLCSNLCNLTKMSI